MSAEVAAADLDSRQVTGGSRPPRSDALIRASGPTGAARGVLDAVDRLLESTFEEMRGCLREAAAVSGVAGPALDPGPLHVDVVDELAARARHHGKRLRPILMYWGWRVAGADPGTEPDAVRVAAALELLHLFALIQDDVMDRSETRRGLPSLHTAASSRHRRADGLGDPVLFGDSVATLVADLALSEASLLIAPASAEVRRAWRLMTVELVQGQLLDVTHTAGRRRDIETSRRIARFKSGRYTITRPLELGALVAGGNPDLVARLVAWGDLVGDAFAIRDDILGVWGDPERTGKPAGDDLSSGKPTVLLCWAEELLPESDRLLLDACDTGRVDADGGDRGGVEQLQAAMDRAGVLDRAETEIAALVGRADAALEALDAGPDATAVLSELATTIAWRSS